MTLSKGDHLVIKRGDHIVDPIEEAFHEYEVMNSPQYEYQPDSKFEPKRQTITVLEVVK